MICFTNNAPSDMWSYVSPQKPNRVEFYSFSTSLTGLIGDPSVDALTSIFHSAVRHMSAHHGQLGDKRYDLSVDVFDGNKKIANGKWTIVMIK